MSLAYLSASFEEEDKEEEVRYSFAVRSEANRAMHTGIVFAANALEARTKLKEYYPSFTIVRVVVSNSVIEPQQIKKETWVETMCRQMVDKLLQ